ARELKTTYGLGSIPANLPVVGEFPEKWVKAVAKDLAEPNPNVIYPRSVILVGPRQPAWVHALAFAINGALDTYRRFPVGGLRGGYSSPSIWLRPAPAEPLDKSLKELVADMRDGKVGTLLVVGGNPVFNAPADLRFADELQKVAKKIRLGLYFD